MPAGRNAASPALPGRLGEGLLSSRCCSMPSHALPPLSPAAAATASPCSGVVVLGDADAPRTVIIERGLPTDNLNNGAGALRSNVACEARGGSWGAVLGGPLGKACTSSRRCPSPDRCH